MRQLVIDKQAERRLSTAERLAITALCPFNAIEENAQGLTITAGCKMCQICVKQGPQGLFTLQETEEEQPLVDKSAWRGIAVYIDHTEGQIHPVSLELLGKARQLALKVDFPVYALFAGHNIGEQAQDLLHYGVDEVFVCDYPQLDKFLIEPYTNVCEDFIRRVRPSVILVGATTVGRSLAPRVAARLRTGLTADCTKLDIKENTDLVQIRPAFGGNIMAQIVTPRHRPQMATVRYKIFDAPARQSAPGGKLTACDIAPDKLASRIKAVAITAKEKKRTIAEADVIVAVGRGIKAEKDLAMAHELAKALGAEIATTRPFSEAGWVEANRQIGLSGRTVKPKLIITLGISGSVQFKAGMENSELIIAINSDGEANIFDVCHYALHGDIYDIVPKLMQKLAERGRA